MQKVKIMLEFRLQKIRYFIAESDSLQKSNKVVLLDLIYMDGFRILILQKKNYADLPLNIKQLRAIKISNSKI